MNRVQEGRDPEPQGRPSLLTWQNELVASPGYRAIGLMEMVKRIAYILQSNLVDYKSLVAKMQHPEFAAPFLDVRNPAAHDGLLSEAERLLHNVLAAIKTRVDQLRVFMNENFADDRDLMNEFRERIRIDFDNPQARFLGHLRNHMTHHRLPVALSQQTFGGGPPFSFAILLRTDSLLEWEWPSGVKSWLKNLGDVDIIGVVDDYCRRAGSLDKWLYRRIEKKYELEIAEFRTAAADYDREVERVFGS